MAEEASCRLREITGWSLVEVAGWRDSLAGLREPLARACGAAPPAEVGGVAQAGALTLIRIGPGRLWIVDEAGGIEARLAGALDPAQGCLTSLGHGRRRWRLEGPGACEILAKGMAIDLAGPAFAPGRAAQTGLYHMPVLVHRLGGEMFDLYLPRSFVRDLIERLCDAGLAQRLRADALSG